MAFALAKACGGRVAVLPQVPNQPLYDGKKEDDLISETFLRYLDTKDPTWPLLLPMVKSAVRAMDALQAFGERDGKPIKSFVVTGASKRGWTTWLTAATQDPRVIAIAPMVIPTLNFHEQNPHQIEVWGQYSEQIADYVSKGLMEKLETEDGKKLTRIVDPFFYLDRIKIPVLQINGTNDRYWTLDSMNLFWPDIAAPKAVVYLPNAGHGLDQHRDYAIKGVGAVFRHAATGRPLPAVSWEFTGTGNPSTRLDLRWTSGDSPKSAVLWSASAPTQDFREVKWEPSAEAKSLENGGASLVWESQSKDPWRATFGDMTFEIEGLEYHLSTLIQVVGPGAGTGPAKAPSPPSKSLPVSPGAP